MLYQIFDVLKSAGGKVGLLLAYALVFLAIQYFHQIVEALKTAGWRVGALLPIARHFRVAEIEATRPFTVIRQFWFNARMTFTREVVTLTLSPLVIIVPDMIGRKVGTGWFDLGQANPQTTIGYIWALSIWLLAYDFFYYWFHRLQHAHWFFWASHRVHHSDEAINPSTSFRSHWLEALMLPFLSNLAMVILLKPVGVSVWATYFIITSIGFFAHSNLRISFGPWFMSPQYHRIHHSCLLEHQDKNLAFAFPFYDILFGTYYQAAKDEYPRTGLYGGEREVTVWWANVVVFKIWYDGFSELIRHLTRVGRLSPRRQDSSP